jgi:hypothetical protein
MLAWNEKGKMLDFKFDPASDAPEIYVLLVITSISTVIYFIQAYTGQKDFR